MGWHMKLVICVQLAYVSVCLTREMSVIREWTTLDVQLPPGDGQESRRSIVSSADFKSWFMYKDRVFVNLRGQPYSLAYLNLTENSTSALLRPYPSYENQQMIYHVQETSCSRVDRCDRLWKISLSSDFTGYYMIVFDLKTDSILINSSSPDLHYSYDMTFDDSDCDNEYVYISSNVGVWTYSWADGDLWRHISHPIIISMIMAPNSIVYYNADIEPTVYYISTTHLRDKSNETSDIIKLGRSRKLNVDLDSSALDAKSDVLYYFNDDNRTVIHAVPCWTSERCSSICQDVSIDPTHELYYITVDENGYLWAITRRSNFEDGEINFRLLSVPVKSTCVESNVKDTTNTSTDVEPNANDTTNTANIHESTTVASSTTEQTSTLGSVPKHTTVNIADTTAGTPNSNVITQAVGGTNMPYLLFSIANTTFNFNFNLSNFTIK